MVETPKFNGKYDEKVTKVENHKKVIYHKSNKSDPDILAKIFKTIDHINSSKITLQSQKSSPVRLKNPVIPGLKTHEKNRLDAKIQEALLDRLYKTPDSTRSGFTSPIMTNSSKCTPTTDSKTNTELKLLTFEGHRSPIKLRGTPRDTRGSLTDRSSKAKSENHTVPRVKQKYLNLRTR